jgi:hypothetical protein
MSKFLRKLSWFILWDVALTALLFTTGLALKAMKISVNGHEVVASVLGPPGIVFGAVLPVLVYLLIPAFIIWIISWTVVSLRRATKQRKDTEG